MDILEFVLVVLLSGHMSLPADIFPAAAYAPPYLVCRALFAD